MIMLIVLIYIHIHTIIFLLVTIVRSGGISYHTFRLIRNTAHMSLPDKTVSGKLPRSFRIFFLLLLIVLLVVKLITMITVIIMIISMIYAITMITMREELHDLSSKIMTYEPPPASG